MRSISHAFVEPIARALLPDVVGRVKIAISCKSGGRLRIRSTYQQRNHGPVAGSHHLEPSRQYATAKLGHFGEAGRSNSTGNEDSGATLVTKPQRKPTASES
jgi:hypothetical protein